MSGPQLLRFSQTPNPRLQKVSLNSIHLLSNRDLFEFLSGITSTLKSLHIRNCEISRGAGEEYALDAVVHKLTAIEHIIALGDCASPLAVARKVAREGQLSGRLRIEYSPGMDCRGLVTAMETSGWRDVAITWAKCFSEADEVLEQKAMDIAKAKGITFESYKDSELDL